MTVGDYMAEMPEGIPDELLDLVALQLQVDSLRAEYRRLFDDGDYTAALKAQVSAVKASLACSAATLSLLDEHPGIDVDREALESAHRTLIEVLTTAVLQLDEWEKGL